MTIGDILGGTVNQVGGDQYNLHLPAGEVERILRQLRAAQDGEVGRWAGNPYPGLRHFNRDEADIFFGRQADIDRLVADLSGGSAAGRTFLVTGASGVGKSSFAQAGVIPRLAEDRWTILPTITPGRDPIASLATALGVPVTRLERRLKQLATEAKRRATPTLLFIDQAEALVTTPTERQDPPFARALTALLGPRTNVRLLATVRDEYAADVVALIGEASIRSLEPLDVRRLTDVISKPAERASFQIEASLVARLATSAATASALPLLAFVPRTCMSESSGAPAQKRSPPLCTSLPIKVETELTSPSSGKPGAR